MAGSVITVKLCSLILTDYGDWKKANMTRIFQKAQERGLKKADW